MHKIHLFWFVVAALAEGHAGFAQTIAEDFSSNPVQGAWRVSGDTSLFTWDSDHQNLRATWDSSRPNSYFYQPLDTILGREDDFRFAFDLQLNDIGPGTDTNKLSSFPIAIGFLNLEEASKNNFVRGTGTDSPDLVDLSYFWDSGFGATTWPTLVDTNASFNFSSSSDYAVFALTPGDWYHVVLNYSASNQTMVATLTNSQATSGVQIIQPLSTSFADFRVTAFSISSYADAGQDPQYAGSVLAHGLVDNIVVTVPASPVGKVTASGSNETRQIQFVGRAGWIYLLQRSSDLRSWSEVSGPVPGLNGEITLHDTNAPASVFYRVRAVRP